MTTQRIGCLGVALLVLLAVSVLLNLILILARSTQLPGEPPKFEESIVVAAKDRSEDKIALIYLRGIITAMESGLLGETMIDDLKIQLRQASDDEHVKAIVLYIDSPGGEVTASDVLYNAVRNVRDQVKKPVVVYMGSLAASGGYYVACGGSWLIANETTFTGSIGVIMSTLNYQQLFGKVGLESVTFKSGKFKDMLSGARQMTDEEKEYIQALVMQTYDQFVGIVARERKLPEDQLRTGIADGRVLSGKDAHAAKLIHQLGEVEAAYAKAMELGKSPGAAIVRYEAGFALGRLFRILGQSEQTKVSVEFGKSLLPKVEAGRLYYLPSFYAQ